MTLYLNDTTPPKELLSEVAIFSLLAIYLLEFFLAEI